MENMLRKTKNKSLRALTDLNYFYNLPSQIKLHLIRAQYYYYFYYILPILRYPTIPLVTISKSNQRTLQTIQNKALRFAYNEKFPYTRDTKTLHELARLDPLNLHLYNQAKKLINKMQEPHFEQFSYVLENYEANINHAWFKKAKKHT